jgi:hypothetical protein
MKDLINDSNINVVLIKDVSRMISLMKIVQKMVGTELCREIDLYTFYYLSLHITLISISESNMIALKSEKDLL